MSDRNENQTGSAAEQLVEETLVEEIHRRHVRGVLGHVGNKGVRPRRRVRSMQIGVAHPGGFQLHQGFTVAGVGSSSSETCSGARNSVTTTARMVWVVVSRVVAESRVCVMASFQS